MCRSQRALRTYPEDYITLRTLRIVLDTLRAAFTLPLPVRGHICYIERAASCTDQPGSRGTGALSPAGSMMQQQELERGDLKYVE